VVLPQKFISVLLNNSSPWCAFESYRQSDDARALRLEGRLRSSLHTLIAAGAAHDAILSVHYGSPPLKRCAIKTSRTAPTVAAAGEQKAPPKMLLHEYPSADEGADNSEDNVRECSRAAAA
jgi:hypothetical protein